MSRPAPEFQKAREHLARELSDWNSAGGPVEAVVAAVERLAMAAVAEDRRQQQQSAGDVLARS